MANKVSHILRPLLYEIGEPLLVTIIIALFASQIENSNILMTIIVVVTWVFCWGIYIFIRHGDLVSKIFSAFRKDEAFN